MGVYIKGMGMPKEIDQSITIEFATGLSWKLYARYHDYNSGCSSEWYKVIKHDQMSPTLMLGTKMI